MSTHTPGPWEAINTLVRTARGSRALVAVVPLVGESDAIESAEQAKATAALIAAAPEMLEALLDLVTRCDGIEGVREDGTNIQTMRAHAAIAKAEGR